MSNELELVNEMFDDYENPSNDGKGEKIDYLAKMFVPRNPKEIFRMLPPNEGEKIIEKAYFHQVQTNDSNGRKRWRKLYCLKKNGDRVPKLKSDGTPELDQYGNAILVERRCPLCEEHEKIMSRQNPTLRGIKKENMTPEQRKILEYNTQIFKEAKKYEADLYHITKGVDKLAEKDGVKFWRFKDAYKKDGVLNKLIPVISDYVEYNKVAPFNPEKGADLRVTVVDASMPNGRTYKAVSAISIGHMSQLHNDQSIANSWLNDKMSWRQIYKPVSAPNITPEEYMEMVVMGQDPYWDDSNPQDKRWVFPNRPDLEKLAKESRNNNQSQQQNQSNNFDNEIDKISNMENNIHNVDKNSVGNYKDNHVDLTNSHNTNYSQQQTQNSGNVTPHENYSQQNQNTYQQPTNNGGDDFDDLPF